MSGYLRINTIRLIQQRVVIICLPISLNLADNETARHDKLSENDSCTYLINKVY